MQRILFILILIIGTFTLRPIFSQTPSSFTPDQALQKLMEGNQRYVEAKMKNPRQGAERREELTQGQNPFAVVLGCSDSRVPPEVIFDRGLGDLFVVRVAGNTVGNLGLGSIEYATQILGAPLILVLGHDQCGAVDAVLKGKPLPGHIQELADHLRPALKVEACQKEKVPLECSINANVDSNVAQLIGSGPVLAPLIKAGKLKVVGGRYDLKSGKVVLLGK